MQHRHSKLDFNTETKELTGETYYAREWIKSLGGKWNPTNKSWVIEDDNFLENDSVQYAIELRAKEIEAATVQTQSKQVVGEKLVNGNDGFYKIVKYSDGTQKKLFVG